MNSASIFSLVVLLIAASGHVARAKPQADTTQDANAECSPERIELVNKYFTHIYLLGNYNLTIPNSDNDMKDLCR